jgi:hypothetical protein
VCSDITSHKFDGSITSSRTLHTLEAYMRNSRDRIEGESRQIAALHGYRDRRTNQTVEPVIIRLLWSLLSFVNASAAGLGLDEVLRGQMLR